MSAPDSLGEQRIKVEKGLERQATVIGFRLPYLGVFAAFFFFSIMPMVSELTMTTFGVFLFMSVISFILVKHADERDLINRIGTTRFPKILVNDLYKTLKDEPNQIK